MSLPTFPAGPSAGGSGTGYQAVVVDLDYPDGMGPVFTDGEGAPAGDAMVGSVHHDTNTDSVYLYTSEGWQGPFAAGDPVTVDNIAPGSWIGSDGDFWIVAQQMETYEKVAGSWGLATSLSGWSVVEVEASPGGSDGAEGDWAWLDEGGGAVRLWGPKRSGGWDTDYLSFTGIDGTKIRLSAPPAGFSQADELWIRPGTGQVLHSGGTAVMPLGGYCVALRVDVPIEVPEGLVLAVQLEASTVTYGQESGDRLQAAVVIEGAVLPLSLGNTFTLGIPASTAAPVVRVGAAPSTGGQSSVRLYHGQSVVADIGKVLVFAGAVTVFLIPGAAG